MSRSEADDGMSLAVTVTLAIMLALTCVLAALGMSNLQGRIDRLESCPALRGCAL